MFTPITSKPQNAGLVQWISTILAVLCAAVLPLVVGETTVYISLKPNTFFISSDFYYYYKFIFFCVTAGFMLLYSIRSYFCRYKPLVLSKFYIAFVLLILLSSLFALNSSNAFFGIAGRYQGFYSYFFYLSVLVFSASFLTSKNIRIVLYTLFASAGVIAAIALLQYYGIELFFDTFGAETYGRYIARGTIGNRNFLGSYFTMLTPIAVVLYLTAKTRKRAVVYLVLSGLFFSGLVVSLTRVAWLGFLVFLVVMSITQYKLVLKNLKRLLALLLIFILIFSCLALTDGGRITNRGQNLSQQMQNIGSDSFGSGRALIYRYALQTILRYPILGTGSDCLGTALESQVTEDDRIVVGGTNVFIDKAHSEYLEIAATMGLPAFLCFFLFLIMLMFPLLKRFKKLPCTLQAIFCGVGAYLVQAACNIGVISVLPVFYVLAGILLKYSNCKDRFILYKKKDNEPSTINEVTVEL